MTDPTRPTSPRARSRWTAWLGRLLLLVSTVALGLGACEAVLRLVSPGYSPLFLDIFAVDDYGELALRPGVTRRHVTREWDVTVTTNAEGLRDRSVPVEGPAGNVVVVGDSFAFGWGVELPDAFPYVAEEALRPDGRRVVKAGLPGTGTSDQARWLDHYGDKHRPAGVVVAFFVGNDFTDVQMGGFPAQFTVQDGQMVKISLGDEAPSRLRAAKEWLRHHSLLAQRVAQLLWAFERTHTAAGDREHRELSRRDHWLWEYTKVHLRHPPDEARRAVDMTLDSLDSIRRWCDDRRAAMILLVIPSSWQVYDWERAKWAEAFQIAESEWDVDRPQRLLAEWAARRNVTVLDLLPAFRAHHERQPDERLYFYPDGHLNMSGHHLAGALLADVIRTRVPARDGTPDRGSRETH